jgi:hypothetical protein
LKEKIFDSKKQATIFVLLLLLIEDFKKSTKVNIRIAVFSCFILMIETSVAEPHHFYAAPTASENFDEAPAPTLQYSEPKFLKGIKVNISSGILFSSDSEQEPHRVTDTDTAPLK